MPPHGSQLTNQEATASESRAEKILEPQLQLEL